MAYRPDATRQAEIAWDTFFSALRRKRVPFDSCVASRTLRTFCPGVGDDAIEKAQAVLGDHIPEQYKASLQLTEGQMLLAHDNQSLGMLDQYQLLTLPLSLYWWQQIRNVVKLNNSEESIQEITESVLPIALMNSYSQPASIHDTVRDFHVLGLLNSDHYGRVMSLDLDARVPKLTVIADSFVQYFDQRTQSFLSRLPFTGATS